MASLYRPTITTYQLPDGKHRTPDGKRVTKHTPGAVKISHKSAIWYGKYLAPDGIRRRVPLCADKTASKQMLAKLVTDAKLSEHGMANTFEIHRKRPLAEHAKDYRQALLSKNNCPRHIADTIAQCLALFEGTGARYIADLDADRVSDWLAAQRRDKGMGISTSNHYLTAVKGFSRWLVKARRAGSDALAHLSRLNAETDVRRQRRDLSVEEAVRLLEAALTSAATFRGLTGEDRHFIYAVAMQTGLRAGELASVTPAAFDLEADPPVVRLQAAYSKRRRNDVQPLPVELALVLRPYLAGKSAEAPVWPGKWARIGARMIARDLAAARLAWIEESGEDAAERQRRERSDYLAYRDEDGRVFDFHATRHSYITLLVKSGAHPKMAQSLARHSTITLTMDRYAHVGLYDQAAALLALPSLLTASVEPQAETICAIGTDATTAPRRDRALTKPVSFGATSLIPGETEQAEVSESGECRKPLEMQAFEPDCERLRAAERRVGDRTRTGDNQIHSLEL